MAATFKGLILPCLVSFSTQVISTLLTSALKGAKLFIRYIVDCVNLHITVMQMVESSLVTATKRHTVFLELYLNTSRREKRNLLPKPKTPISNVLISTSQTDIPTPAMPCPPASLPVSVAAVVAYCLNPAGRPGTRALQTLTVPTNRPALLALHRNHLQSSRHT